MEPSHFLEWGTSNDSEPQDPLGVCRICANTDDYYIQIYSSEGKHHSLAEKINNFLPISVSQTDVLPTQICFQCTSTVMAFSDLVSSCLAAEKRLINLLNHRNVDQLCVDKNKRSSSIGNLSNNSNSHKSKSAKSTNGTVSSGDEREMLADQIQPGHIESRTEISLEIHDGDRLLESDNDEDDGSIEEPEGDEEEISVDVGGKKRRKRRKERISKCPICGKVFPFVEYLNVHLVSHSKDRPHQCDICGATFKRKDHLNHHRKTVHMNHPDVLSDLERRGLSHLSCEQCGEVRPTPHLMRLHKKKHLVDSVCNICEETFDLPTSLKEHMAKAHPEVFVPCTLCGKLVKSGRELFLHKQKHSANFMCDVCGKSFAQQSSLKTHMVIHSDERPYACDECEKSFKSKARLQLHKKSHSDLRPYACSLCKGKRFKTKTALTVHNNMHNDVRRYPCPHCSFRARKNSDLVNHVRTHTGEKPYKCNVCGRGFAQAGDMRKHRATHERQKTEIPK